MYKFSSHSLEQLATVHPDLQYLAHEAMKSQIMDFRVVEGARTLDRQKQLVADGKSRTMKSKHLVQDDGYSHAMDLYPYPVDMEQVHRGNSKEVFRFGVLAGIIHSIAKRNKIVVVNGADWDSDGETLDHTFFDAPHFQLVKM